MNNSLAQTYPELVLEWSDKNFPLMPNEVSFGSNKKILWKGTCGHEWTASVKSRARNGTGCPYCAHRKVLAGFNDLASLFPEIAAEWSERNLPLKPSMVTAFANSKVWWKCRTCGNEWYTLISTRSGGSLCPYCSGHTLLKGFNDLKSMHPFLAEEWSDKNDPLKPDEVNAKSRKNVWWHCKTCGNEWQSVIHSRVKGAGCPVCAERAVLTGFNDFSATDRNLLNEWDYRKNKINPEEISRKSYKRVWWQCRHGHSFSMKVSDRAVLEKGCPVCEKIFRSVFPALAVSYYANKQGMRVKLGSDEDLGIPLEIFIPSENLVIESSDDTEEIELLKHHLCRQRHIKRIKLPFGSTESCLQYAEKVKAAFKKVHIFIRSDTEADVQTISKKYNEWRNLQ